MTNRTDISRNVMRRVYFVHTVRPFISNASGALVVLGVSLYLLGREVFVAQVFRNIPSMDPGTVFRFFQTAFLNTTFLVQVLTVLIVLAGCWLASECVRLVRLSTYSLGRTA